MPIVSDERCAAFISEKLGHAFCPPFTTMGIEREGKIIAAVLFNNFEGPDVAVSIAGTGWAYGFAKAVGRYVFQTLGCIRMTATTESEEVAGYACRLGGQIEGRMRNHFGYGRDGLIIGILKSDWTLEKFD